MKRKLILFGIDGAPWSLIDRFVDQGCMPNFKHVLDNGVKGTLMSTFPSVTLAAWTSIFTGVNPGKHGMIDFRMRVNGKFEVIQSNFRKVDTLWKILSKHDLKVIVINDPVSYPPETINGIMTTGMLTPHNSGNFIYPSALKSEVERVADGYVCEPSFDFFAMASNDKFQAYLNLEELAKKHARVALHLAKKYEWDVLAPIFTSTDRLQHFFWNEQDLIKKHYVLLDEILADFLDMRSTNNADLFIVSDHGFGSARKALYINTWLTNNGFQISKSTMLRSALSRSDLTIYRIGEIMAKLHLSEVAYKTFRLLPQSIKQALPLESSENVQTDYEHSQAYSITYQGIYINDNLNKNDYERIRNSLISSLYNLKDGETKLVERIYKREDVVWGSYENMAPDLIVQPIDGYCLSTHMNPHEVDKFTDRGAVLTGNHRPEGIFVAYGPDIIEGLHLQDFLHTWDITPTLMHILELPVPNYFDGKVARQIFKTSSDPYKQEVHLYGTEVGRIKKRLNAINPKFDHK